MCLFVCQYNLVSVEPASTLESALPNPGRSIGIDILVNDFLHGVLISLATGAASGPGGRAPLENFGANLDFFRTGMGLWN